MTGGPRISRVRSRQPTASGMGLQFTSPHKARDKRKNRLTTVPGQDFKRRQLLAELEALKAGANKSSAPSIQDFTDTSYADTSLPAGIGDSFSIDITMEPQPTIEPDQLILKRKRSVHPDPEPVWLNKTGNHSFPLLFTLLSRIKTPLLDVRFPQQQGQ